MKKTTCTTTEEVIEYVLSEDEIKEIILKELRKTTGRLPTGSHTEVEFDVGQSFLKSATVTVRSTDTVTG